MNLEEAFKAYTDSIQSVMSASRQDTPATETIRQSTSDVLNLRDVVEDLESRTEFQTLIKETGQKFSKEPYTDSSIQYILWRDNIENFFRRSGLYLSAYNGETQDIDDALRRYVEAFEQDKATTRYLVPVEFVDFGTDLIDFGTFRIVRFSQGELETLLQTKISQIFFPYAYADLAELSGLWFIEVVETTDAWEPGSGGLIELPGPEVNFTFTEFPPPVEYALKILALYDWGTYQAAFPAGKPPKLEKYDTGWERFHVPFIIKINENQLWGPAVLPHLSVIATQPESDPEGEDLGERPVVSIYIDTDQFKKELNRIAELMAETEENRTNTWAFMNLALGYLVKAFFASGLDQLLWHMVVVESLLGDKGDSAEGLKNRLRRRAAFVTANKDQELSKIKKLVEALYTFRSDMVHGNVVLVDSSIYLGHLREARELAKRTALWFLESLSSLNKRSADRVSTGKIPTREDILAAIDVLSGDKLTTDNVKLAIDTFSMSHTKQSS